MLKALTKTYEFEILVAIIQATLYIIKVVLFVNRWLINFARCCGNFIDGLFKNHGSVKGTNYPRLISLG